VQRHGSPSGPLPSVTLRVACAGCFQGDRLTYVGNGSSRSVNRVLITLVVITIVAVATWAMTGGLDEIQATQSDTAVVSE